MEGEKGVGKNVDEKGAMLGEKDPAGKLSPASLASSASLTLEEMSAQRVRWKKEPMVVGGRREVFTGSEIASLRRSPYERSISISSSTDR